MLTKTDKKYIEIAIHGHFKKEVEPFFIDLKKDVERHVGVIHEDFNDKFKVLYEMLQDRPTRSEVKDMIKAETDPIRDALTHHILFD